MRALPAAALAAFAALAATSLAAAQPGARETQTLIEPEIEAEAEAEAEARAQAEAQAEAAEEDDAEALPPNAPDLPRRALPNYDGREDAPPTAGDVLLWIPRIVFYPVYFVTEYLVRRPLAWLVTNVEEYEIADKVVQFFTFGPDDNIALAPSFSFDLGIRPNIGIYFRWNDFLAENHALRAGASFGGIDWVTGSLAYRYALPNEWELQVGGGATKRPDGPFHGLGSEAQDERARFNWVGYRANVELRGRFWRQTQLELGAGYRYRRFGDDITDDDDRLTIPEALDQGLFSELPPGYEDGYSIFVQRACFTLDSRPSRPAPGTGIKGTAMYELAFDLRDGPAQQLWVRWGGSLAAYADVSGNQHVVGVQISASAVEALAGEVPFTELPQLSGNGPLRGFLGGYLRGESEFSVLVDYHWPVWVWLDATLHVAVGNVYDGRWDGFSLPNMRLSAGIGLAAVNQRDHFFEFLVGFGTETFEDGAELESVRVLFGGVREF